MDFSCKTKINTNSFMVRKEYDDLQFSGGGVKEGRAQRAGDLTTFSEVSTNGRASVWLFHFD